jgi:hypothetical protein
VPRYSPEGDTYTQRVHRGDRPVDPHFAHSEWLYRRVRQQELVDGRITPLLFQFPETSGISVNRQIYSEPQDVLEPDCCDGQARDGYLVLQIMVQEIPESVTSSTGVYQFRMKHVPKTSCYPHSEVWCNQHGDVEQPYQKPPPHARKLFYGKLIQLIQRSARQPLRFDPANAGGS